MDKNLANKLLIVMIDYGNNCAYNEYVKQDLDYLFQKTDPYIVNTYYDKDENYFDRLKCIEDMKKVLEI